MMLSEFPLTTLSVIVAIQVAGIRGHVEIGTHARRGHALSASKFE